MPGDAEREARQVQNAKKMLEYYTKERKMLDKKLGRARGADDQLHRLETSVAQMEAALQEAAKRGRELLMLQKEKQRLLAAGGSREDSGRKLVAMRDDIRVARERLRRATEGNEADAAQVAMAEQRLSDMTAEMRGLEDQYSQHMRSAHEARAKLEMEATQREKRAARREAEVAAVVASVEAEREAQLQQRVKAKVQLKELKHEVSRLEEMLKEVLNAKKRVELKAKAAQERARERERERVHGKLAEREREAMEMAKEERRARLAAKQAAGKSSDGVNSPGGGGGGGGSTSSPLVATDTAAARRRIDELAARLDEPAPKLSMPAPNPGGTAATDTAAAEEKKPAPSAEPKPAEPAAKPADAMPSKPALGLGRPREQQSGLRDHTVSASDAAATAAELVANAAPQVSDSGLSRRPLGAIGVGTVAAPPNATARSEASPQGRPRGLAAKKAAAAALTSSSDDEDDDMDSARQRVKRRGLTPEKAGDIHAEIGDMGSPVAESPVKKGGGHSPSKMSASADEPAEEYDDEFEEDFEEDIEEISEG